MINENKCSLGKMLNVVSIEITIAVSINSEIDVLTFERNHKYLSLVIFLIHR